MAARWLHASSKDRAVLRYPAALSNAGWQAGSHFPPGTAAGNSSGAGSSTRIRSLRKDGIRTEARRFAILDRNAPHRRIRLAAGNSGRDTAAANTEIHLFTASPPNLITIRSGMFYCEA